EVVPGEVDQHPVLRELLRVGEQGPAIGREAHGQRSGDGVHVRPAAPYLRDRLRGTPDDLAVAEPDVVEVREPLAPPQPAGPLEEVGRPTKGASMREHDLERLARADLLHEPRNAPFETGSRERVP